MKLTLLKSVVALVTLTTLCNCSLSRGELLGNGLLGGGVPITQYTNSIENVEGTGVVLDQVQLDGSVGVELVSNTHPTLEIQILSADETKLLACTGVSQDSALTQMGEAFITYGNLNAELIKERDTGLRDDTSITIRLVERLSSTCPTGIIDSEKTILVNGHERKTYNDELISKKQIHFGDLLAGKIELPRAGRLTFRSKDQPALPVAITPPVEGGKLTADQIKLTQDFDYGEATNPELAILLYENNNFSPMACAELFDLDAVGMIYGTLHYGLISSENAELTLDQLNDNATYSLRLVELDNGGCTQVVNNNSAGVGITFIQTTLPVAKDELVGRKIPFVNSEDYVVLTTL